MQKNAYGKGFRRDGLPDATFGGYPPNGAIDIIGQLVLGVRNIVGVMRAEGTGSAGFYRSRVEQIFRKREEAEGGDKKTPESEEKIASDREERFAKHFQNPCRRESLVT